MKKRVLAAAMAIVIAAGSVVAVGNADAHEFTAAELYEPTIGGAFDAGPDEVYALLIHDAGPRMVSAELNLFESPYPGLEIRKDTSAYASPHAVYVRLEGGKIYPERFDVLTGVTVHYDDGSSEYVEGSFTVRPLKALVAGQPAEPIKPTTTPRATVSVTATTTVTEFYPEPYPEPYPDPYPVYETETVTATAIEFYPEPYPEISYETETVTATTTVPGDPVTVTATASANPVTVTETPAPKTLVATETATIVETVTKTASAQTAESGSSLSTGGIVGIVLAVLAALGAGAFALSGGLPPQIAKALSF